MIDSRLTALFRASWAYLNPLKRYPSTSRRRTRPIYTLILSLGLVACAAPNQPALDFSTPAISPPSDESADDREPPTRLPEEKYADLEIVTLLPRDAIPAIDDPQFLTVDEADRFYDPDELVLGVSFNGVSRAYSVPFLSNHEIVNDTVGGVKIAVTW